MHLSNGWIGLDPILFPDVQKTKVSSFDNSVSPRPAMLVFRKKIVLKEIPDDLTAFFSGDCKYRLFVNGRFVDDGPVEVGGDYGNKTAPDWWFYDTRNLSAFFVPGENVIVAELLNVPEAQTDYSTGQTGFAFELVSGETTLLLTDSSWRTFVNPAYQRCGYYSAFCFSGNYHDAAYDDSSWAPAVRHPEEMCGRWNLKMLRIPPLREETLHPVECRIPFEESGCVISNSDALLSPDDCSRLTVQPGLPAQFFLRFPEECVGHIEFDVESAGGAVITLEYMEYPGKSHSSETYVAAKGRHTFRGTRLNAVLWIRVSVACGAFSANSYAPVHFYAMVLQKRSFPLPRTASFECSDPALMKIRETIDRTMRMCMLRMHLDSPVHQEGLGCTGDYWIESLISYALYGETRLAKADILRTAYLLKQKDGFMFHTSYSLLYFDMVRDYYMQTGDRDLLDAVFPALELVLNRFAGYVGETGLVSRAPNYMFIDWINDGNQNYHHPPAERGMGCLTAFYAHALRIAAELAAFSGRVSNFSERADAVEKAFQRELWREEKQLYCDGIPYLGSEGKVPWCPPDEGVTAYSVHTNALALAYGFVPRDKVSALIDRIMTDASLLQVQPYFAHFVFEALFRNHSFSQYGSTLMHRWLTLAEEHPEGLKECWNCGDYSHAWGGSPALQISRSVLGIYPIEPAWKKVRIAPHFGTLTHAEGEIPSLCGTIHVVYNGSFATVTLPAGMEYECAEIPEIRVKYRQA